MDSRQAAEAAFKSATTKPAELPPKPGSSQCRELVSLRIDRDVLDHFQESGPGWQDQINEALRRAAESSAAREAGSRRGRSTTCR